MRLLRLGPNGQERPYVLLGTDLVVPVDDAAGDFDAAFFRGGGLDRLRRSIEERRSAARAPDDQRVGPPVARPGKIVCIGLNYADHARESGAPIPDEPVIFLKAPYTLVGPHDDVFIPRGSSKTDYEVELGVVIGKDCRYLRSGAEAMEHVAGYMICNDVSEREFQLERGGQWDKGKSCETFNPAGPWLVTPDEIDNVHELDLWLQVNGEYRQRGSTRSMIFSVAEVVRYVSQFMVLEAGDVINTGTPPGVALGMKPPRYLQAGDVVELGIEGLGAQRQRMVPAP